MPPQQFRWLWGYTGHEQLDAFGLVNMNARLYDPKLGRLLSVDNYVSDPASPLAYNRYTYALNNPISYVDPSGNHPVLVAMMIGAAINAGMYLAQAATAPGGLSSNFNFKDMVGSSMTGAILGGVTSGVGQVFGAVGMANGVALNTGMSFAKEAGRAAAHGVIGGGLSASQGGDFWTGFASGGLASFASSSLELGHLDLGNVGGAFFSAGVGAGSSYLQGGNPWMGAAAGLMSYTLNHIIHKVIVIHNTQEALAHYLTGNGESVYLDEEAAKTLLRSKKFIEKHKRIVSGATPLMKGDFSVDLTWDIFHIGRTNVEYNIVCSGGQCTVTYTLFVNDGFYDVDVIDEKLTPHLPIETEKPDGLGPNLERYGGKPYLYNHTFRQYTFPNPGY